MKLGFIALGAVFFSTAAFSQQYVSGYYRSNGTYVAPYYRSTPDGNPYNNYSTRGNVNPYTGQVGTRSPVSSYSNPYSYTPPVNTYTPYTNPYGATPTYKPYTNPYSSGLDTTGTDDGGF